MLALLLVLPLLAACMGDDDDDDPTATSDEGAAVTATAPEPTEEVEPTEAEPTEAEPTATEPEATPTEIEPTEVEPTEAEPTAEEPEPTPTEGEPAVPGERPIDQQLSWLLGILNSSVPPAEEIEARMHPSFNAQLPPDQFAGQLAQLAQAGPWTFNGYLGSPVALDGTAVVESQAGLFQIHVGLEVAEPHRFQTLLFLADVPSSVTLTSLPEVDPLVSALAPNVAVQIAEISGGVCAPLHTLNPDEPLAIASGFKHWVLLELAERVAAGEFSWDDELPITDELRSLPSGTLQVEPTGTSIALSTYAAKMMVLSDNTATDHLIDVLGRESVEARMAATGNSAMDRNVPLLLTRELFYLKLAAGADVREAYIAADDTGQRAMLDEMTVDFSQLDPNMLGLPVAVDSIEWFASAADLCEVQAALFERAGSDTTLQSIMAAASGMQVDGATWPFVAFKGGDEAGVAARSWLLQRADGRVFSINIILNNPDTNIDPSTLEGIGEAIAGLLAGV